MHARAGAAVRESGPYTSKYVNAMSSSDARGTAPLRPQSMVPGIGWPRVLQGLAATMEVLQAQLRASERAAPAAIRALQQNQIELLAAHAHAQSPFWRARLAAAGYGASSNWFAALPILGRGDAQAAGAELMAREVPKAHGRIHHLKTSGSTGTPLLIAKTDLALLFWKAMTLRDSLWRGRDLRGKLAAIRVGATRGVQPTWGSAHAGYVTGPAVSFDAREDIDAQLDWLEEEQPQVLLTHASNLRALARRAIERACQLPQLREACTYSEQLAPDLRDIVRAAWNVPVTDMYSANETGYLALQCPHSGLYHVQAEDVLVEVVGDDGAACGPGESGRVVATPLHNFAMPLLRYDLGDYATVGPACACGRTLPTLEKILGRTRNMLRLPGGRTAWPGFPMNTLVRLQAIRELRMIQHTLDEIEIELVLQRALTAEEATQLVEAVRTRLQHPFNVRLTQVAALARGPGHKREDFECRVN